MDAASVSVSTPIDQSRVTSNRRLRRLTILCVTLLATIYALPFLQRGWLPFDDGMLAQTAQRVLQGELPHRDFDDPYTGGLTYLNAAGFYLFGTRLVSLRLVLLAFYVPFVAAVCAMALRFVSALPAALFTFLCVAWSLPNYFAALPSWYNLFFAVYGVLAVTRYWETSRKRYLVLAGVLAGLSVLLKITGVYLIAAILGAILFVADAPRPRSQRTWALSWLRGLSLVFFAAIPVVVVWKRLGISEFIYFVLPVLITLSALVAGIRARSGDLRRLSSELILFITASIAPLVLFVGVYWIHGAVGDLCRGVLVLPLQRLQYASLAPRLDRIVFVAPYALLLLAPPVAKDGRCSARFISVVTIILGLVLALIPVDSVYSRVWASVMPLPLLAAGGAAWVLSGSRVRSEGWTIRRRLVLLLALSSSYCGLVQFPYSSETYFCYVAPLIALTLLSAVSQLRAAPLHVPIAGFYLGFAVLGMNPGYVGVVPATDRSSARFFYRQPTFRLTYQLDEQRAGILVTGSDANEYRTLIGVIQKRSRSPFVYAGPDCPEVCFLSGFRNPTRVVYDFLDGQAVAPEALVDRLVQRGVTVAVINHLAYFSPPMPIPLRSALEHAFPDSERVGRFEVRWRP